MKRFTLIATGFLLAGLAYGQGQGQNQRENFNLQKDPPAVLHWARHSAPPFRKSSPEMTYHGGPVLATTRAMAIFWGKSWETDTSDKMSGLNTFYSEISASTYAMTNREYQDSTGAYFKSDVTYLGPQIDTSAAPKKAPSTSAVLSEVCKVLSDKKLEPEPNGFYAVYSDQGRGRARYCAWHSYGDCGGTPIEFSFYFNLDGDSGCSVPANNGHSEGLSSLANVTGHELSEAVTDPQLNAWYDGQGAENADKCAWTFSGDPVVFGTSSWIIQGNWSNAAYAANGAGYDNGGCIDGSAYSYLPPAP